MYNNITLSGRGIIILSSNFNNISYNDIHNSSKGIEISVGYENEIYNNILNYNGNGIYSANSGTNYIVNNNISNNYQTAIYLMMSENHVILDNMMNNNGVGLFGFEVKEWNSHIIDSSNMINQKPIFYGKNMTSGTVPMGYGQIILANCTNVMVENQNINNGSYGVLLGHCTEIEIQNNSLNSHNMAGISLFESYNVEIENNNLLLNRNGIYMEFSEYNNVTNNEINSNTNAGIYLNTVTRYNNVINNEINSNTNSGVYLDSVTDFNIIRNNSFCYNQGYGIEIDTPTNTNQIYHNNFIDNTNQAYDLDENIWDAGYPLGGNYWSDYIGVDLFSGPNQDIPGSDGIGDIPYDNIETIIGSPQDNYPLMQPVGLELSNYILALKPGWNLISLPLEQADTTISTVLSSINSQYDAIKYYDATDASDPWKTYRPGASTNDLASINHKMGFWIEMNDFANLTVEGIEPASTDITLYAGWNLVGYPTQDSETVANALFGTGADRVEVCDLGEPYLIKEVGPTYMMKPGEGYWVHVPADTVWTVDW